MCSVQRQSLLCVYEQSVWTRLNLLVSLASTEFLHAVDDTLKSEKCEYSVAFVDLKPAGL